MRILKFFVVTALSFGLSYGALQAQGRGPAELPPSSFKGKQFVDSRGCAFIRAGQGLGTTWVPRVTRQRKQLCGFRPTFTAGQRAAAQTAPRRQGSGGVVDPLAGAPIIGNVDIQPGTSPNRRIKTTTAKPKPATTTTRVVRQPAAAAPKTTTRVVRQPKTTTRTVTKPKTTTRVISQQPRRGVQRNICGPENGVSSQFTNPGARCGPQNSSPTSVVRTEVFEQSSNWTKEKKPQRIGPRGVNQRIREARELHPPKGYKTAWKDGRLNPLRGTGTSAGKAKMRLVWSDTVPRRLIDPTTGKIATPGQIKLFGLF